MRYHLLLFTLPLYIDAEVENITTQKDKYLFDEAAERQRMCMA